MSEDNPKEIEVTELDQVRSKLDDAMQGIRQRNMIIDNMANIIKEDCIEVSNKIANIQKLCKNALDLVYQKEGQIKSN